MPGIGNNIRNQYIVKIMYIFFMHLQAHTQIYKDKSFDNFDIIFTNGNYQKIELEERFTKKILKKKNCKYWIFLFRFFKKFFPR